MRIVFADGRGLQWNNQVLKLFENLWEIASKNSFVNVLS